jgi:hypothetical protein
MKIYLVKRKFGTDRWFEKQKDLLKFLIENDSEEITVITVDTTLESEQSRTQTIEQIQDQIQRDSAINTVFGDEFSEKAQRVITLFEKYATRCTWDQSQFTPSGKVVFDKLTTCTRTKADFSKVVKSNSEYLLYNVSDSVDWYKALLEIYGFRKLYETCRIERLDQLSYNSRYYTFEGCRTPERILTAFEKAKEILKTKK